MKKAEEFDKSLDEGISKLPFELNLSDFSLFSNIKYISFSTKINMIDEYFTKEMERYKELGLIT
jgi:hypothetical protein